MAQKKAHEVDGWLRRPDSETRIILIYGPDRGLVAERAHTYVKQAGLDADDPFSSVRLEASELDATPGRLIDEAGTVPMFSSQRLIWIKGAGTHKNLADDVKALAANPPRDSIVLIEAGDLKKSAALRSIVEGGFSAMALPCYADESRSIDSVIDEILAREKMTMALEARQALKTNLGGDRLATRSELEKLALYCHGKPKITLDDVTMTIGDVSSLSVDATIDAVLAGNSEAFDTTFSRIVSSGSHPFVVLSAAMRQFNQLLALRGDMDANGKNAAAAVAGARPPVFFARRKLIETSVQRWTSPALLRAMERLQAAVLLTRQRPDLATATARQALIALLVESARARR